MALQDNLAQIPQGAVMLYPFIVGDRLELIVTSPYAQIYQGAFRNRV